MFKVWIKKKSQYHNKFDEAWVHAYMLKTRAENIISRSYRRRLVRVDFKFCFSSSTYVILSTGATWVGWLGINWPKLDSGKSKPKFRPNESQFAKPEPGPKWTLSLWLRPLLPRSKNSQPPRHHPPLRTFKTHDHPHSSSFYLLKIQLEPSSFQSQI